VRIQLLKFIGPLVLFPVVCGAGDIYQCTAADGSKSFQATPCPVDTKQDRRTLASSSNASSSGDPEEKGDGSGDGVTSCRAGVLKDYRALPKEIEAYYRRRTRQCHENFNDGSSQIKNCYQEQEEIRDKRYKDLEREKERSLASCVD
jgi:hypothetical protein